MERSEVQLGTLGKRRQRLVLNNAVASCFASHQLPFRHWRAGWRG